MWRVLLLTLLGAVRCSDFNIGISWATLNELENTMDFSVWQISDTLVAAHTAGLVYNETTKTMNTAAIQHLLFATMSSAADTVTIVAMAWETNDCE